MKIVEDAKPVESAEMELIPKEGCTYDHSKCPGCQWVNRNHLRDCPVRARYKEMYAAQQPSMSTGDAAEPQYVARDWDQPHLRALNYLNTCKLDDAGVSIDQLREFLDVPDSTPSLPPEMEQLRCEHEWVSDSDSATHCDLCGVFQDRPAKSEMEQLFKKVIMATYEYWDSDQDMKVGKRLRALAGLLPGYDRDIETLLDHIEGKV